VYVGPEGVLTGSMRLAQEARELAAEKDRKSETDAKLRSHERKRQALGAQIAALRAELEDEEESFRRLTSDETKRDDVRAEGRRTMSRSRRADLGAEDAGGNGKPGAGPGAGR
jgi:circadian clock protein KaiC